MKLYLSASAVLSLMMTVMFSSSALAQGAPDNSVDDILTQRIASDQSVIAKASSEGRLTARQAASDNKRLAAIQKQFSKAKARHQGHTTAKDQKRLAHALQKVEITERYQEHAPSSHSHNKRHK